MDAAIQALRVAGRNGLADLIGEHGRAGVAEYSARLNDHRPEVELEPALAAAFARELVRLGWPGADREAALTDLAGRRVVQTATHLTATEGPTFLAVHGIATAGLPAGRPYLVGAFSGVPFSNPAWSACLNFSARHDLDAVVRADSPVYRELARNQANRERDGIGFDRRVSLVPAKARDGLVYKAPVPDRLRQVFAALTPELQALAAEPGESFGAWALSFCQATTRRAMDFERAAFFDLNAWLADYLTQVLPEPDHPMTRVLFDRDLRGGLTAALGQAPTWFYAGVEHKKRTRVVSLTVSDDVLGGPGVEIPWRPDEVVAGLAAGRLCPAVLPCFVALAVINRVRCLGSFEQVEYLPRIVRALAAAGFEPALGLDPVSTAWLTTGRALAADGQPVYPLDVVLGTAWKAPAQAKVWDWLEPLMPRLLGDKT